jgi:hypothetical protein
MKTAFVCLILLVPAVVRAEEPIPLTETDLPDVHAIASSKEAKQAFEDFKEKWEGKIVKTTGFVTLEQKAEETRDRMFYYSFRMIGTEKKQGSRRVPAVHLVSKNALDVGKDKTITGKLRIGAGAIWIDVE